MIEHRTTSIYFLRPIGKPGPIKIGCSFDPLVRLRTFLSWSPMPLEIAATAPGLRSDEGLIHLRFAHLRMHSEWFSAESDLVEFVNYVRHCGVLPDLETGAFKKTWQLVGGVVALAKYRKETGRTLNDIAKRVGVTEVSMSRYERGERIPRPETMRKIQEETENLVRPEDFYSSADLVGPTRDEVAA